MLCVSRKNPELEGRLRLEVQEMFAVLASREPFLWMFCVYTAGGLTAGTTGRLMDLEDGAALEKITESFINACMTYPVEG